MNNRMKYQLRYRAPAFVLVTLVVCFWISGCGNAEHPLEVTIVEQGIPQTALITQRFEAVPAGQLNAKDNINEVTAGRVVQKGSSVWEITDIQFRPTAKDSWQNVPPPAHTQASTYPVPLGVSGDVPYRMIVGFADKTGEWQFTLRLTRTYFTPDKKESWRGGAEHTLTRTLRVDPQKPKSYVFVPGKAYVSSMQWRVNDSWRDIPQTGQPGFPLIVSSQFSLDLQAVQKNPQEPWPEAAENEELWPRWEGIGVEAVGNPGDAMVNFDDARSLSRHARDYKTIKATCGNTVSRQILVVPMVDIFVYEPQVPKKGAKTLDKKTNTLFLQSEATVKWGEGWHPPTKVRFRLYKLESKEKLAKRSQIGQINGPSPADDVVEIPGNSGTAKVKLSVSANAGLIELRAELIVPGTHEGFSAYSRANTLTLAAKQPTRKAKSQ